MKIKKMKKTTLIPAIALATTTVNAQHMEHSTNNSTNNKEMTRFIKSPKYLELSQVMRKLWSGHMHWTLATVDAFFNEPKQFAINFRPIKKPFFFHTI